MKPERIWPGWRRRNLGLKYGRHGSGASQHWSPAAGMYDRKSRFRLALDESRNRQCGEPSQ